MFDNADYDALNKDLDFYPIPMFAAERRSENDPFQILGVNQAHTRATGVRTSDIQNRRPSDFLPEGEGEAVEAHYCRCVDSSRITQYREELHFQGQLTHWETTLLPLRLRNGTQRVIGTALTLGLPVENGTLSDAEYYAAQAQLSLGKINHFLKMLEQREDLPPDVRTGAMMIAGLHRSVDHLLQDLRLITQERPSPRVSQRPKLRVVN